MEFRLLGPLEVIGPHGVITIAGRLRRSILAMLVLHVGETVTADTLIDAIWGEHPPRGPQHALEVHVAKLRRAIGAGWIEAQPNGYRLRAAGSDVDLARFEAVAAEASRSMANGDATAAAAGFAGALRLWRGPALADLATADSMRGERARLDELRALTLERWIDAELAAGRHVDVIPDLRRIVDEMPLREAFQSRLMVALYRAGRQAEALDVYLRARAVLDRDLGVDPGAELEAIQQAVLTHDPGLTPASTTGALVPAPTDPRPPQRAAPSRRFVTIVMADASISTRTGAKVDPEFEFRPLERCFQEVTAVLEHHGGLAERVVGDAVIGVFGIPVTHEDDAVRAVRAAAEIRERLASLSAEFEQQSGFQIDMRAAVNTGEVLASGIVGSAGRVSGDAVNAATGLLHAAAPGAILLSGTTLGLVRSAVDAEAAGSIDSRVGSSPVPAFRLLAVAPDVRGYARRFDTPLIGRERELRQLEAALAKAGADETCQLFSVYGPAGVGKSRLVHEFLQSVRPQVRVLRGRARPYGEQVALGPIVETVRQAADITDRDPNEVIRAKLGALVADNARAPAVVERIAALLGASEAPSTSDETAWAVRSLFEAAAWNCPLVLVFDDIQWGEPAFLDMVESFAEASRGAPIFLVCISRPELLDVRPGWGGGKLDATSVLLGPLDDGEVSRLVVNLLGGSRPSPAVEQKIVAAAEGNPLFVEEFLAMLIDDGAIRRVGNEWVSATDLSSIAAPPSIMALLAARLDRLPADERAILGPASVIGQVFSRAAVEQLVAPESASEFDRRLESLVRREVIRPDRSASRTRDAYRFKHILVRDAAYVGLTKGERIELHENLADWLARLPQADLNAADELIGAHLEQAFRYRTEIGPPDDRAREVGRAASERLGSAGRRALLRWQFEVAKDLLARAAALLPSNDAQRLRLLFDLATVHIELGEYEAGRKVNDEVMRLAEAPGLADLRWRGIVERFSFDYLLSGTVSPQAVKDLEAAIHALEARGDDSALGRAWFLNADVAGRTPSRTAYERAVEHARRAGDIRTEGQARIELSTLDEHGSATIAFAIEETQELLDWARAAGLLWAEALALSKLGRFKAMVGEVETGRRLVGSAEVIYGEINRTAMGDTDIARWNGMLEWFAGDARASERAWRRGYEGLTAMGERRARSVVAGHLARVVYVQGRLDEAYAYTEVAEETLSSVQSWTRAGWQGVRAMILARRADPAAALALANQEVALAEATDDLTYQGRALEDLSEVLEISGRSDEARSRLAEAISRYDQKGITVFADRARRKQAALEGQASSP